MSEPRQSGGCGTVVALAGLIGWAMLAWRWLADHWLVLTPILVILAAGFAFLAVDAREPRRPQAWIVIGAAGQYRVMIGHGPLDSEPTLAEAEDLLRHYGQTSYRMVTDTGEKIVKL